MTYTAPKNWRDRARRQEAERAEWIAAGCGPKRRRPRYTPPKPKPAA